MTTENILEVVRKLVGNINPSGRSEFDNERFENLKVLCKVVNSLVGDIDDISFKNKDSYEYSVKIMSEYAGDFLTNELGIKE